MLRYGYFPDFKGGPKVLLWGTGDDMQRLYEAFSAAAEGEGLPSLADVPETRSVGGITVLIEADEEACGMERDALEPDTFHWRVDQEGWYAFQEQVELLTRCSPARPGHQYLQCLADGEIVVIVSCGEYPDDFDPHG